MYIDNKQLKNYISFWLGSMFWIISIMIVVGGLTRLTDSGLSITQWQLFSGFLPPFNEIQWQNYLMTLQEFKVIFWWEWAHRFLGRLIGLSFLIPLIFFSFKVGFKNLKNLYFIFFLICFQGFIGWYMVSSGLINRVDVSHLRLSVHLLIAFLILSLIFWNYLKLKNIIFSNDKMNFLFPSIFLLLIFCQIVVGAFVSGMDAGKIYNSWPLMGTSYFPNDSDFINLFTFNAFNDPSLVQFIHRNLAYLILGFYLLILFNIYVKKKSTFYNLIKIIGFLLIIQIILGIFTLINGAQIFLASMHQISSIFLVSSAIYFFYFNSNSK